MLIPLTEIVVGDPAGGADDLAPVVVGLEDLPAAQAQRPATFDLAHGSHLLLSGAARSGRSSALRTIAGSLARSISPSDLHLYGLDFGNGALLPLNELPHCGGVVAGAEPDRVERLIARLADEVARRQELFARSGLGDIGEQRRSAPAEERLPYVVVVLDRWEGLTSQFSTDSGSELPAAVLRLVRDGAGAGLRLVIAGDRSLLMDRLAAQVEDRLVLRLADRNDYRIAGLKPKSIPENVPAGRAFRAESGAEVQYALLDADPSGQAQAAAVRQIGRDAAERWPAGVRHNRPFRVDVLPTTIGFDEAWKLTEAMAAGRMSSPLWALVGVGGDELEAVGVDLAAEGGFVVAGPSKTGRSTALATIARSLLAAGSRVVAVCPRPSPPLAGLEEGGGSFHLIEGMPDGGDMAALLAGIDGPLAIVVDDAEVLARTPADDAIKEFVRDAGQGRVAVVVGGQLDDLKTELRGTIVEAKKAKAGLLLSPPSTLDGDVIGLRLTRNLIGRMPPGRAILGLHGEARVVQVPR